MRRELLPFPHFAEASPHHQRPRVRAAGALIAVGIGWYESCGAASKVLVRVLRGEQPRNIPFEEIALKKLVLNQEVAKALGITFPPDMVQAVSQ